MCIKQTLFTQHSDGRCFTVASRNQGGTWIQGLLPYRRGTQPQTTHSLAQRKMAQLSSLQTSLAGSPHWLNCTSRVHGGQPPEAQKRMKEFPSDSGGKWRTPISPTSVSRPTRIPRAWECQVLAPAGLDSSPQLSPLPEGHNLNRPSGALCSLGPHCKPLPWPSLCPPGCQGRKTRPGKELASPHPPRHLRLCQRLGISSMI